MSYDLSVRSQSRVWSLVGAPEPFVVLTADVLESTR